MDFLIEKPTQTDIAQMVVLSAKKRAEYEIAQPIFWKKAEANDIQEKWFSEHLTQPMVFSFVAKTSSQIIGFIIGQNIKAPAVYQPGGLTCIVDDFCVSTATAWDTVGSALINKLLSLSQTNGAVQILVVAGQHDLPKNNFLKNQNFAVVSEWFLKDIPQNESEHDSLKPKIQKIQNPVQIRSSRLLLKEAEVANVEEILKFLNDNKDYHASFEPIRPESYYSAKYWVDRIQNEIAPNYGNVDAPLQLFISKLSEPNEIIGFLNFANIVRGAFQACHVGYMLAENAQGNGYMAESLEAAIHFMFTERNFHRIMANYMPNNEKSGKLLQKLGFQKEGVAKDYLRIQGEWRDHVLTSIINPY